MSWWALAKWWLDEIANDPAYEHVVTPLLLEVLDPSEGETYVDFGAGEGRVMRRVSSFDAKVIGLDINDDLLSGLAGSVAVTELPLVPLKAACVDGAYAVLVLEHLADVDGFFEEARRVVKPGGVLALVSNHPVWTAPNSTPIQDEDGEILWRPGDYFSEGVTSIEVKGGMVRFHHRTLGGLFNAAALAGWVLEEVRELPHHSFPDQSGIPRLLGVRWRLGAFS